MTRSQTGRLIPGALLALFAGCGDGAAPIVVERPPPRFFLSSFSGDAFGAVNTTLSYHPFTVQVHDGQRMLSGVPIVWQATGAGISILPAADTSDSDGRAWATVTLGPSEGQDTIIAAAPMLPGAPQVRFTVTTVTIMVEARDLADGGFTPASVTVPPGGTVGWRYASGEGDVHDVTFEDGTTSGDLWIPSLALNVSEYYTRLFEGPARTIGYQCRYHSSHFTDGEVGTVVVQP